MRRKTRVITGAVAIVLLSAGLLLLAAYLATQQVPDFYRQAATRDRSSMQRSADEMGTRATALYSDVRLPGPWHALFTVEQINSWLAIDLAEKHPDLLPEEIQDPRVAITPGRLTFGFRTARRNRTIVISIDVGIYLTEPGVVACRFYRARAGRLRLPLKHVLEQVTQVADRTNLPIRWGQAGGDPVVLIEISSFRVTSEAALQLDKIELLDGQVYLAGHTLVEEQQTALNLSVEPQLGDQRAETDAQRSDKTNVHR